MFFFGLLFQLKRIHLVTSYLANLAGIPHLSPLEPFLRSQLWDGQSGDFHWANAFSSGGMDLSPFSRQACGGKLSLGESMVFRSANKRLFLIFFVVAERSKNLDVGPGWCESKMRLIFFLTPDVFGYIHIIYSKRYLYTVQNYIFIMYMHELSIQLLICIDYSTCWWVWSYSICHESSWCVLTYPLVDECWLIFDHRSMINGMTYCRKMFKDCLFCIFCCQGL